MKQTNRSSYCWIKTYIHREVSRVMLDKYVFPRHHMKRLVGLICVSLLMLGTIFALSAKAAILYGLVGKGERCLIDGTGCTDEGMLVRIESFAMPPVIVGDTGIVRPSGLAFDPVNRRLVAARSSGPFGDLFAKIYEIDKDTAAATEIVSWVKDDPELPPDLVGVYNGMRYLESLEFHPSTGELYCVINDGEGDFLARLDLSAITPTGTLEIDLIGAIGKLSPYHAPFGFTGVSGIAFDPTSAELFGVGTKQADGSIHLIKINTTHVPIPDFATEVGDPADDIASGSRAMAADPEATLTGSLITSALSPTVAHVLVRFNTTAGNDNFLMQVDSLDGQIVGLAYFTEFVPSGQPPEITSFRPYGGNAGINVTVYGSGFTREGASGEPEANISAVYFNGVPALSTPVVISDTELRVVAPNAQTGKIKVVALTDSDGDGQNDEAVSAHNFYRTEFTVIEQEFSQGIPSQPLIAGKDTLVRLFTASSIWKEPVTFGTANLIITKPNLETVPIPPTFYTQISTNSPDNIEISHRHNINFYVSGDDLDDPGTYTFDFEVRAFSMDPVNQPGQIIYQNSANRAFVSPPGNFRVLYLYGCDGPEDLWPNEIAAESISRVFQEASRVLPVRNGISRLGDDDSAGVQYEFIGGIQFKTQTGGCGNLYPPVQFKHWDGALENVLETYNEANCDHKAAEYVVGFVRSECVRPDSHQQGGAVPWGVSEQNKPYSVSTIYSGCGDDPACDVAMTKFRSKTAIHEFGHCMGRVGEQSPNHKETDKDEEKNHSENDEFPPPPDDIISQVRAFNVPGHVALETLPRSVMHGRSLTDPAADGTFFFEDFEYNKLLNATHRFGTIPHACYIIGCSWPFCSDLYLVGRIEEDDAGSATAEIIQSYIVHEKPLTEVDPDSPYALVFLDASSQILAQDPFSVSFGLRANASSTTETYRSTLVSLTRPLPEGTTVVQIRKNDQILAALSKSNGPPTIDSIVSPSEGQTIGPGEAITIEWVASDPDGDPLHFSVSYSPNPDDAPEDVRWFPIARGITDTSFLWMTGGAPGTDGGRIRIMASDGFYPTIMESATFAVASKAPTLSIVQPEDGQFFQEFDNIVLEGMAFDLESGMLSGNYLEWSSNVNGALGIGPKLVLSPGTLDVGIHNVTLSASDGDSVVQKTISITVLADSDRDGLSDDFESQYDSQDPEDPYDAGKDADEDGLSSLQEDFFGTNPENSDTDGDGMTDGEEIAEGGNPLISDNTPPVITPIVTGTQGNDGWYTSDVTVQWEVVDGESNITSTVGCGTKIITSDNNGITLTCAANSSGGNASESVTIKRDATAPSITVSTPPDGASFLLNEAVAADYNCVDSLSGMTSCTGPVPSGSNIETSTVGTKGFTVTSADNAGNSATLTYTYNVQYQFSGYLPPILNDGSSIFKAGRTVPVKFQLTEASSNFITDASATLELFKITDDVLGSVDVDPAGDSDGDTTFRYDAEANQYICNLSTKGYSSGTYVVSISLNDGTNHQVQISLR